MLVLRTCRADLTSHGGFQWKDSGFVFAPDWRPSSECGNGLHGYAWGEGDAKHIYLGDDVKWLVVDVADDSVIDLGGKVKYPSGNVVFCGGRDEAIAYLVANGGAGRAIMFHSATAGYAGTATAGYAGTATAGYAGTATAGDSGTATAGDSGTATAGIGGLIAIEWLAPDWNIHKAYGIIGQNGLLPNVAYRLNASREFEVANAQA